MKIVSHYLQSIDGIAIYPIITLIIFLSMFIAITIWAMKISKKNIQDMKQIPFDDGLIKDENPNY
ncbi:MAG: CcoQ/FixQ family Cbb3-type cytochrome c oxidase assembly chaperone [Bacteroidetes bacterium HGW-Bacteroidetes-17]|jgi:cbb3-type cytochrome oxidase subunit 3|nr:MAG: CcoQ/FixQ family Cbb3-type cytochrome c oxidase assembly chaperone [Bacteroidetes bacterium HGW-Bacteroidetes-17]